MPIKYPTGSGGAGAAPGAHATSHEPGGSDAMAVNAAAGTGSLRTLGSTATSAAAGNDARLPTAVQKTAIATREKRRELWYPTGVTYADVIDEPGDRIFFATAGALTSGTLRVNGNVIIPAGETVTRIAALMAATTTALTHSWAMLGDLAGNVLAISADITSQITVNTWRIWTLGTPYLAVADIAVFCGVLGTTTSGNQLSLYTTATSSQLPPTSARNSTTTLTDPASLGATYNVAGGNANHGYVVPLKN